MKRIWMSALLLLTALFAARAQAETVYDRGNDVRRDDCL